MTNTHNGWTNYATWRINLEIMDGYDWSDFMPYNDLTALADEIKSMVEETVLNDGEGLCADYAQAFLNEVNYYEIARCAVEDYPELLAKVTNGNN